MKKQIEFQEKHLLGIEKADREVLLNSCLVRTALETEKHFGDDTIAAAEQWACEMDDACRMGEVSYYCYMFSSSLEDICHLIRERAEVSRW